MYIEKLKLKNYRNYKEIEINFSKHINILYGNNAEGKTNLLESIYMCSTSKSHKNNKENEIIKFNEKESHIKLFFNKEKKEKIIDIQLNSDYKKGIAVNGVKVDKISDFLGLFNVIMFAPEDLNIIKDGPQVRRKFLDIEICQTDKIYVNVLSNYNRTINQRNKILKDLKTLTGSNKDYLIEMLDTYDEKLIEYGIEIIKKRKKNIEKLAEKIKEIHYKISDSKETLIIDYENELIKEKEKIENEYKKKLIETRELDIKNQYTFIGPHRDDISFMIEGKDIRKFGSQGQKKTAAISLKLAELEILREKINETPVLLLDDVFSEIDETRQKLLVNNIKEIQTIITCTGIKRNIFELLNPDKIFQVVNNNIIEKK